MHNEADSQQGIPWDRIGILTTESLANWQNSDSSSLQSLSS